MSAPGDQRTGLRFLHIEHFQIILKYEFNLALI